jgi:hypothetical protein
MNALLEALDASSLALRRDLCGRPATACGDYAIRGKSGHIYADGSGYLLCVTARSTWHWTREIRPQIVQHSLFPRGRYPVAPARRRSIER